MNINKMVAKLVNNFNDYPLSKILRPKNESERKFFDMMVKQGWLCSKKGFPDFFVFKKVNNEIRIGLVEIKPYQDRKLKKMQLMIMELLSNYGVPCHKWTPEDGFVKIIGKKLK